MSAGDSLNNRFYTLNVSDIDVHILWPSTIAGLDSLDWTHWTRKSTARDQGKSDE